VDESVPILGKNSFTGVGSIPISTVRKIINYKQELFRYSSTRLLLDPTCYYIYPRMEESQLKVLLVRYIKSLVPRATFAIMTVLFM